MKRLLAIVLITLFVAVNCLSASALADNEDSMCYNANDDSTFSINTGKEEVKRLFPGLKEVESRDVDRSLPIIEVNSVDELAAIINSLNSAFLYKNQPVNERRPKYYNGNGAMVYDMFPGLTVVDSDNIDHSIPVIEIEELDDLAAIINASSSVHLYKENTCSRSPYGGAKPYTQNNSSNVNCYGYAGEFFWFISPGDIHFYHGSPFDTNSTISEVADWVQWDYNRDEFRACRSISSATSSVSSVEWRMALRIGKAYIYYNGAYYLFADFHFMKQTNTGYWAHKPGSAPSMLTSITNPSTANWHLYGYDSNGNFTILINNFYNSTTKYFAVKKIN